MKSRDFKGIWIPKEVWMNKDLKINEKIFLVEIDSLDNENGCWASNKYFADFFGITKGRCSQIISSLQGKGLILINYEYKGKEIKRRTIKVVKKLTRVFKKLSEGYLENDKDNNTKNNNTSNINKELKFRRMKFEGEVFKETYKTELCREFVAYWTEPNKSKTKMRFELQKTWDTKRRLQTWYNNEKKFNKEPMSKIHQHITTNLKAKELLKKSR